MKMANWNSNTKAHSQKRHRAHRGNPAHPVCTSAYALRQLGLLQRRQLLQHSYIKHFHVGCVPIQPYQWRPMTFLSSSRLTPSSVSHRLNRTRLRSHVALCVDTTKKTLAVIVDGKLVGTFRDNSGRDMDALGNGFAFHSRSSIPARISNVSVTKWDGDLPSGGTTSSLALKQDFVEIQQRRFLQVATSSALPMAL